jgi:hypothetical protein
MAQQEQRVSKGSKSLRARLHILAYICAFIFLYIEGDKLSNMRIQGVGILFLVVAFLILIGQLRVVALKRVAKFVDTLFIFPMYIVFIAIFINGVDLVYSTGQVELLWAIPVVILGIIVHDIIDIVKGARENARLIGKKATAIRWLKALTFVLLVLVIFVRAGDVQRIGKPIFWLIPAVISFTIVLFLDGTFKKIVYDIIDIVKGARENARLIGKKATAIRWLKALTFVLLVLVIFVRAFESPEIVKPLFWLIPAVISFMIVLILESNIKK